MFNSVLLLLCSVAILVSGIKEENPKSIVTAKNNFTAIENDSLTGALGTTPSLPISTESQPSTSKSAPTTTTTTSSPPTSIKPPSPPTPVPPPETKKWIVNGTTDTCIIVQMALQFNVSYITKENQTLNKVMDLPANSSVNGACGSPTDMEQNITLSWHSDSAKNLPNNLTLHFVKNITKHQFTLHLLEVSFAHEEFPDITSNLTTLVHKSDQFTTGLNNSYRCLKIQALNLTSSDNQTYGQIKVSDLQFQAFHLDHTISFGYAEDCAFDTPDIVPIAVGCALAVLVIVILAAYLVGRRRSQAKGYRSM